MKFCKRNRGIRGCPAVASSAMNNALRVNFSTIMGN
jgi:hypothetical protein